MKPATKSGPESRHAAQSKQLLARRCGGMLHQNHYIAGFQLPSGRQLPVERCGQGLYLWTEPCPGRIPSDPCGAFRRAYAVNESRNADLNGRTSPRLKAAWLFDTLGDLDRFVDIDATL